MSDDNPQQPLEFIPPSVEHLAELLPAYSFESLIATGGMGAVYKANQTSLDRPVAVKILPPELGKSETFRESFVKEAKLMARLNHPNLISVFDFGEIEDMLYIVMEFVDGDTLYQKSYGKQLEQQDALEIIIAICRGLANAHEAGILHRDIKPANIFITESGIPKIGDFGLARPSGDTETGVIFGTPGYTAPEVLNARDKVGPPTDIFAVGVMLYELLAAKIPGDLYEPITKYSKCDPMIDRFIRKAIAAKIEQRYSSAEDFADDLNDIFRKAKQNSSSSPFATEATQSVKLSVSSSKLTQATALKPSLASKAATLKTNAPKKSASKPAQLAASAPVKNKAPRGSKTGAQAPPQQVTVGGGGANVRNFIIIIVLLGAIYGVLQWKSAREAEIARIEKQNENIEELTINQPSTKAPNSTQVKRPKPPKPDPVEIPVAKVLTPLETLEKLRTRLAAGDRPLSEMPKSTISLDNGERLVLFVDKELTWHQAQLWAAEHGGQLATLSSATDVTALRKAIPAGEDAWVGAATGGNKQWAWCDGSPWTDSIDIRKTSKLAFAQLDSDMFATAKKSTDTAKFLIEWKKNGAQPSALAQQMGRVADTLDKPTPLFPAGSVTFANRNYYLCPHPLTLIQAQQLAKSAGAQIATPSDDVEMAYFSDFVAANVPSGQLCRIGGILDNTEWKWLSGEKWQGANWEANFPKEQDSIVIASSSANQWRDAAQDQPTSFTLFEWSKDAPGSGAITLTNKNSNGNSEFQKLQSKASKLVSDALEKREKEHTENVKRLKWDLEVYFKGLAKNDKVRQALSIQEIQKLISGVDRIKQSVSGMGVSGKVQKLTTDAYEKQGRIDTAYNESIERIRLLYQKKLESIIQELESKSQVTAAKKAKQALNTSRKGATAFLGLFK